MSPDYFRNQLYPLQDKTLAVIAAVETDFYLTGGTVVSRHLLHHRYSDDLDLFVNRSPVFKEQSQALLTALQKAFGEVENNRMGDDFCRYFVTEGKARLKIELVNDVGFHAGTPEHTPLFVRTDNWENILSNKICALSRNAAKDIADLLFLARKFPFDWQEAIMNAQRKDTWVMELSVSQQLYEFPVERLQQVAWISPPDYEAAARDLRRMGLDVFEGVANSLAPRA